MGVHNTAEIGSSFCVFLYSCSLAPAEIPLHVLPLRETLGNSKIQSFPRPQLKTGTKRLAVHILPTNFIFFCPPQCHCPSQFHPLGLCRVIRKSELNLSCSASLAVIHKTLDKTNGLFDDACKLTMFLSSPIQNSHSASILSSLGFTLKTCTSHSQLKGCPLALLSQRCVYYTPDVIRSKQSPPHHLQVGATKPGLFHRIEIYGIFYQNKQSL